MPTREKRMSQLPTSLQKTYEKSVTSKAAAIKSFCIECTGYDRKAVTECTDTGCPLWHHRPYQRKKGKDDVEETDEEIDLDAGIGLPEAAELRGEDGGEHERDRDAIGAGLPRPGGGAAAEDFAADDPSTREEEGGG